MPFGTIKIDRSTRWGNPFKIGKKAVHPVTGKAVDVPTAEVAVSLFEIHLQTADGVELIQAVQRDLRGRNLACWCKAGHTCHGDVLLRIANAKVKATRAA